MVKVGFIVEGDTEKIIVESKAFGSWLTAQNIQLCEPVIDAKGGGNLLPQNIGPMVSTLRAKNVDHIVILTDLEDDPSLDDVRNRIGFAETPHIFIAVKAIEAWILADTQALQKWLGLDQLEEDRPEETLGKPWDRLKELAKLHGKPGPGGCKPKFAKKMTKHFGFATSEAACHPHCPSAKAFCDGLTELGLQNSQDPLGF